MRSLSRIKLPAILLPFLFIVVVLLINDFDSTSSKTARAEYLLKHWQVSEAVSLLREISGNNFHNSHLLELYSDALIKSGELYQAKNVLQKLILLDTGKNSEHKFMLAKTFYFLGSLDSAEFIINQVLKPIKPGDNPDMLSKCFNLLGLISFNKGEYKLAEYYQKESLRQARIVQAVNDEANALRQLGVLEWYNGNDDSVIIKYYLPALELYQKCNDKIGEATTLSNIGLIYNVHGDWLEHLKYQIKAFQIRKEINDQIGLADSYYFLTFNFPHKDEGRTFAYKFYQKSYDLSTRIGYAWGREIALRCLLDIQSEAVDDFNVVFSKADSAIISSFEGKIHRIWNRAKNYSNAGDYFSAAALYMKGIQLCDSMKYYSAIEAPLIEYSQVLIKTRDFYEAEKIISRTFSITRPGKRAESYAETLLCLANLYDETNRRPLAAKLYSQLIQFYDSLYIDNLNKVYPSLAFESAAGSVHYRRSRIYKDYFKTVVQLKDYEKAFEISEKERLLPFWGEREYEHETINNSHDNSIEQIINIIEQADKNNSYQNEEAQNRLEEIYKMLLVKKDLQFDVSENYLNQKLTTVGELQKLLNTDEIILEYFIDDETAHLFAVRNNIFAMFDLEVSTNQLANITDIFNETILLGRNQKQNNLWKDPSKNLYNILIAPLIKKELLKGVNHLFISAHQFIHSIPFSCLLRCEGASERFLIQDYDLNFIPSANYFSQKRKQKNEEPNSITIFAPDFSTLPYTSKEAGLIKDLPLLTRNEFNQDKASASNFLKISGETDILHVAAHGVANRKYPLNSYIVFKDRNLFLNEILSMQLNCKIVLLSSCEAGLSAGNMGTYPSGHDMVSFPRAFISSGSSSVIAPLWIVDDESTFELMKYFYDSFFHSENSSNKTAASLASAQRKFLSDRGDTKKIHPFYWASFFITGYSN